MPCRTASRSAICFCPGILRLALKSSSAISLASSCPLSAILRGRPVTTLVPSMGWSFQYTESLKASAHVSGAFTPEALIHTRKSARDTMRPVSSICIKLPVTGATGAGSMPNRGQRRVGMVPRLMQRLKYASI